MKLNKKIVTAMAATAAIFGSVGAQAATATATVQVTATILPSCIFTVGNVALGNYNASAASDLTGTGTIEVTCSKSLPYTVQMNGGQHGTSEVDRKMKHTAEGNNAMLNYKLNYNNVNFDTSNFIQVASAANTGVKQTFQVGVVVPKGQYVPVGAYEDNLTATLAY